MDFVSNKKEYWKFILDLRNHPSVKVGFIQQEHISEESHIEYMKEHSDKYFVCLIDGEPAGYVGVINKDIRVATHPKYQGRGVGKFMIDEIMKIYPSSCAKIKMENEASIKLFEKCGFKKKYYILEKQ
tara:strand:+ start:505 stop:888 length:384 start_codon:yes stop_codon:yes gene_type:complete